MGCGNSKNDDAVDPGDVKLTTGDRPRKGKKKSSRMHKTRSGFTSDIEVASNKTTAETIAEMAVNANRVGDVYDVDEAAVLGRGACGTVCVVRHRQSGEKFAMKTVALDAMSGSSMDELRREIEIQRKLDHPNIVKLYESFEEPQNNLVLSSPLPPALPAIATSLTVTARARRCTS